MQITVNDTGAILTSEPIQVGTAIQILATGQLGLMQQALNGVPAEHIEEAKGALYDTYNQMCSAVLETFAPEIELRPDLTAEAIMKAENEILDAQEKNGQPVEETGTTCNVTEFPKPEAGE